MHESYEEKPEWQDGAGKVRTSIFTFNCDALPVELQPHQTQRMPSLYEYHFVLRPTK